MSESVSPPDRPERMFLLVPGAQKAGTTWLYHTLRVHPAFAFPTKEAHVFDRAFVPDMAAMLDDRRRRILDSFHQRLEANPERAHVWQRRIDLERRMQDAESSLDRYPDIFSEQFDHRPAAWITGDMTPDYSLLDAEQVKVLRRTIEPIASRHEAIVLLRDPVDRMISELRFFIRKGFVADGDPGLVDRALMAAFFSQPTVVGHTLYDRFVPNFEREWGAEHLHVEFYERLFTTTAMERLGAFLGIEPVAADFSRIDNPSGVSLDIPLDLLHDLRARLDETYRWAVDRFGPDLIRSQWKWAKQV